jgi:hypothetical protein
MIAAPHKERGVRSLDFSKFHEAPKAVETAEKSLAEHPAPAPPGRGRDPQEKFSRSPRYVSGYGSRRGGNLIAGDKA